MFSLSTTAKYKNHRQNSEEINSRRKRKTSKYLNSIDAFPVLALHITERQKDPDIFAISIQNYPFNEEISHEHKESKKLAPNDKLVRRHSVL